MSQQPLDLRKSMIILKRFKLIVALGAAAGLLAGAAYGALNPPGVSSTAVVSLPASVRSVATEVLIGSSDPVLSGASAQLTSRVSIEQLRKEVQVQSLTGYLMSITATTGNAADAEAVANAVAESFIAYVANGQSPVAHIDAGMLQPATTAARKSPLLGLLIAAMIGAVVGAVVGSTVALAIGRRDRRLRSRDQLADSIGLPVLASVPVSHPADPPGWTKLLESYQPKAVHAWQLRTLLRYFGVAAPASSPGDPTNRAVVGDGGMSLAVVSLSADPGALALGPQVACYAAAQGIPTALVIGPHQDAGASAVLRSACAALPPSSALPQLLRVVVSDDPDIGHQEGVALSVVVMVADDRTPRMPATVRTTATVLGVSAGRVTAEQVARAAVAVGADGQEIAGILVADPEATDKTTGRIPQLIRPRRQPNRLKGVVTESTR